MSETRDASKVAHSHLVPTGATRGVDWGFVTCVGLWQLFMFVVRHGSHPCGGVGSLRAHTCPNFPHFSSSPRALSTDPSTRSRL